MYLFHMQRPSTRSKSEVWKSLLQCVDRYKYKYIFFLFLCLSLSLLHGCINPNRESLLWSVVAMHLRLDEDVKERPAAGSK